MMGPWTQDEHKNLSLQSKMVLGGMLILLIPLVLIGTVTFLQSSRGLEDISRMHMAQIAKSLSDMVEIALEKDLRILSALAEDAQVVKERLTGEHELTRRKLSELYPVIGTNYEGLAVFDQNGILRADGVDQSRAGISISERSYYAAAREKKAGVGPIVASKVSGRPVFGLCAPIISPEGNFIGGVLGIAKTDYLLRYIASMKFGNTGYAFMIDREGKMIAHPNEDYILTRDFRKETGLEIIAERMTRQETGTEEYIYRGIHKIAGFTPVQMTGWSIGITQNKEEIMALAYANRNLILMVSGVFVVLTVLAVFFFSRTISEPVQKTLTSLNQAVSQATEAFVIMGLDGKVKFANPAMAAIIDRPIEALIGTPLSFSMAHRIDMEEIRKAVVAQQKWSDRIEGTRADGSAFTLDLAITPVRNQAGAISDFLAIGRDIYEELSMQTRIRQSEKMEAVGTLAGGIAHDFNNILSAVFGYAELTLDSLEDRKKCDHYLKQILKAAARARDLVNHILAFSRQTEPGRQPVIPKYIVKEALKLLRASLPSTIEIRETLTSPATVLGDPTQIHQVVVNLCTNAGYAMREQGGVLEVSLDEIDGEKEVAIQHVGMTPGRYLRLKVSDSGNGIPANVLQRIFDPFFTTKPPGEGTGLGLSVVHGIIKSLNGSVHVSSEMQKGTVFTIYLPTIQTEATHAKAEKREEIPRGSERIMLVDDETALIQSGAARLEGLGYQVKTFIQGELAWEAFMKDPSAFDAIVTDYTMPLMTGYDLAMKVREVRLDIPIILCSGYLSPEERIKGLEHIVFIKKPVTTHDIAHALRQVLDAPGTAHKKPQPS
jgi:PAS domain S-box-containing protein